MVVTHVLPLSQAPHGYHIFNNKVDGCIKVVLQPGAGGGAEAHARAPAAPGAPGAGAAAADVLEE